LVCSSSISTRVLRRAACSTWWITPSVVSSVSEPTASSLLPADARISLR
jgi:hypothetical protein